MRDTGNNIPALADLDIIFRRFLPHLSDILADLQIYSLRTIYDSLFTKQTYRYPLPGRLFTLATREVRNLEPCTCGRESAEFNGSAD